tara:strand:- start:501 stop:689 length:189 start_codon:yes stop_codon:yes gene_type:complete
LITIVLFDENGQYEISLPTNDSSEIELEGHQMREYEMAVAGIATQFLDMETDPTYYPIGTKC